MNEYRKNPVTVRRPVDEEINNFKRCLDIYKIPQLVMKIKFQLPPGAYNWRRNYNKFTKTPVIYKRIIGEESDKSRDSNSRVSRRGIIR